MKRRLVFFLRGLALFLTLTLCLSAAQADSYVLHKPGRDQLKQKEAVALACDFIKDLTGATLTGLYATVNGRWLDGQTEAYFGPGNQWYADTEDDCWVLTLRNETPIRPMVVVHGATGEVLYWEYEDREANLTYIHMQPQAGQMSFDDARALVTERFAQVMETIDPIRADAVGCQGAFGAAGNWLFDLPAYADTPAWSISLRYPAAETGETKYSCSATVNADTGDILQLIVSDDRQNLAVE